MGYFKNHFENFVNRFGHYVIVKHTDKKQKCPNNDGNECSLSQNCPQCFGNNYLYDITRNITIKSQAKSMYGERLQYDDSVPNSSNTHDYFFCSVVDIGIKDFVIEYTDNKLQVYEVINYDRHHGDDGEIAFQSVLVREVNVETEVIEKSLKDLL